MNQQNPYHNQIPNPRSYGAFPNQTKSSLRMAGSSLVCSCIGLLITSCGFGFIFGAFGILFGLLSKGGERQMAIQAKVGILLGVLAIIASFLVYAIAFALMFQEYGGLDGILAEYQRLYQSVY